MNSEVKANNDYLDVETEYMAAAGFYTDSGNAQIRSQAVSIIATNSPNIDPDAFIPYLAMNYFDRYFSTNQFQDVQDVKSDFEKVRLIALCCLFISAKMRLETFSRIKYVNFTQERIMEMEINILKALHWRLLPVTPFVYLNYYYQFVQRLGGFKRRCINEIIVQAQGENEFVCYKPSIIAMSAFLVAAKMLYPSEYNKHHYQESEKSKEVSECVRALHDLCVRKNIKIEPPHDERIPILTDEIGNKTHVEEGLLEAGTTKGEAKKLAHDKVIAILTDEIGEGWTPRKAGIVKEATKPSHAEIIAILADEVGNKADLEEGSLESEQKAISNEIVEIDEEEKRRLAKGKAVATSNEENRRLAKSKMVAVSVILDEERQRQPPKSISQEEKKKLEKEEQEKIDRLEEGPLEWEQKASSNEIVEIDEEEKQRLAKGKTVATSLGWEQKAISNEIVEIDEEEKQRLAQGKAVATSLEWEQKAISNEIVEIDEEEEQRLDKGKAVATSLEWEQKVISNEIVEVDEEEEQRIAKGKAVATSWEWEQKAISNEIVEVDEEEEEQRIAKGKAVATSWEWEQKAISNEIVEVDEEEEEQRIAKGKAVATSWEWEQKAISNEIVEVDEEEEQRLAKGKAVATSLEWEQKAISNEIVEIDKEEEQRLAKGKAVATSNEENRRLAKGKMVAVSEILDEERQRQPPKSISEEEKKKLEKEEQEKIDRLEVAIKLAMEKGKLEKGVQVGRSLGEFINEPHNPMIFDLKWPDYAPS